MTVTPQAAQHALANAETSALATVRMLATRNGSTEPVVLGATLAYLETLFPLTRTVVGISAVTSKTENARSFFRLMLSQEDYVYGLLGTASYLDSASRIAASMDAGEHRLALSAKQLVNETIGTLLPAAGMPGLLPILVYVLLTTRQPILGLFKTILAADRSALLPDIIDLGEHINVQDLVQTLRKEITESTALATYDANFGEQTSLVIALFYDLFDTA